MTENSEKAEETKEKEDIEEIEEKAEEKEKKENHPFFQKKWAKSTEVSKEDREQWILSRLKQEEVMEYLKMEQKKSELLQQAKDTRTRYFFTTFQLTLGLVTVAVVVYLLRDNPTILTNILYIGGMIGALRIWRK